MRHRPLSRLALVGLVLCVLGILQPATGYNLYKSFDMVRRDSQVAVYGTVRDLVANRTSVPNFPWVKDIVLKFESIRYAKGSGPSTFYVDDFLGSSEDPNPPLIVGSAYVLFLSGSWTSPPYPHTYLPPTPKETTYWIVDGKWGVFPVLNNTVRVYGENGGISYPPLDELLFRTKTGLTYSQAYVILGVVTAVGLFAGIGVLVLRRRKATKLPE